VFGVSSGAVCRYERQGRFLAAHVNGARLFYHQEVDPFAMTRAKERSEPTGSAASAERQGHAVSSNSDPGVKARRPYSRHGLNAVKAQVKVRGLSAIDRRTAEARALLDWREELLADLGGAAAATAAQLALVDLAARTRLYIDHLDAFLLEQTSGLVNKRRRAVYPVLRERQVLVDSLARLLGQLGLERRQREAPSLSEYIAKKYGGKSGAPEGRLPNSIEVQHAEGSDDIRTDGPEAAAPERRV